MLAYPKSAGYTSTVKKLGERTTLLSKQALPKYDTI